jgi:hypothetical protein
MQRNRTVRGPSGLCFRVDVPEASRVRGLGLCDVFAIEIEWSQIPGLVDEIEERQRVAEQAFRSVRARWDALSEDERRVADVLEEELNDMAHRMDLLAALRAQLPAVGSDAGALLVGPQQTLSEIIGAAAREAAEELVQSLIPTGPLDGASAVQLERAARAALAFVQAHIECHALTWFTFEADAPSDTADAASSG